MALDEKRAEIILNQMKSFDVGARLEGINAAREMNKLAFTEGMSDLEYARSAMILEQQYNLIREELRVKQIRVKADTEGNPSEAKPKTSKPSAKKTKPQIDMVGMMAGLKAFMQEQKKPEGD